jgi:hypothetical protein
MSTPAEFLLSLLSLLSPAAAAQVRPLDEDGVPLGRPPGPEGEPPDGWEAPDQLGVWDCYICDVRQSADIPVEFHKKCALALTKVLERLHSAVSDPDPAVLERAVKWSFVIHQCFPLIKNSYVYV